MNKGIKIGILTVSDRASRKEYDDLSGKEIERALQEYIASAWESVYRVVSDDTETIKKQLMRMSDIEACSLIFTTGGTGPAVRDNTPEATEAVCGKLLPGFGELMRTESLKFVPTAILSRQTAGIRNSTLIINLPGQPKSIRQCLEVIFPAIPYCIDLIHGPYIETRDSVMKAFRPGNK
jgi:molybdopterin adenylyltransferase